MSSVLLERVEDIERRFRGLERELGEVRAALLVAEPAAVVEPETPAYEAPAFQPNPQSAPPGWVPPAWPPQPKHAGAPVPASASVAPPSVPARPSLTMGELFEQWDLLGARGLAVAGGVVTLLGIAFFFVLAANHGWIGHGARVALGGIASALVFGSGIVLRHRFGQLHAALAAVGTGIAGAYTTLLAAAAIYDLVPEAAALAIAAGIAGAAVAVAVAWSSELVAGLGLLGAAAVPALHALDGTLTASAVGFVVVVFAGATVLAVLRRWPMLLGATAVATAAQMLWLFLATEDGDVGAVAAGGVFFALLVAAAIAQQRTATDEALDGLAASLAMGAAGVALIGSLTVFASTSHAGVALLLAGAVLAIACAAALRLSRDLAAVFGGLALTVAAVGTADLLSSRSLTLVWAAEAIVLGALGLRLRQPRFRLAALVYVPLALLHALAVEAPLGRLFDASAASYWRPVPSLLAVALAAAVVAWRDLEMRWSAEFWPFVRAAMAGLAALLVLDAASLSIVEVSFRDGHPIVTGLWAVVALGAVAAGARRRHDVLTTAGFAWLLIAFVKAWPAYDWTQLSHHLGAISLLAVAVPMVLAGVALRVLDDRDQPFTVLSGSCAAVALVSFVAAIAELVPGDRAAGAVVLGPAALFTALAAATFRVPRLRNLTTVLWAHGLAALLFAEAAIIQGRGAAVAAAATAAALAALSVRVRETRLFVAAAIVLGGTTTITVAALTTPDRLVHATAHPGVSLWVLAGCVAAGVALAFCNERARSWIAWLTAGLGVYALSLGILDLAERISSASVATDFQRGHTVVTAFWGLIGLGLLIAGLMRRSAPLRLGGLALFGFALAKLFLYDLSALSSVTRAASFLAVGAFMLAGGFFVQRLSERLERL